MLTATLYATVPGPVTFAPEVIVIHGTLLVAVHAHPAVVPTVTVPVFALEAIDEFVGVMVKEHTAP